MPPIKKRNRGYKKDLPFRDARKFILICEGEREANYFKFFDERSRKLIVETIAPVGENGGKSAPNHLKDRASEYVLKNDWDEAYSDQIWFILDVDKWQRESIEELHQLTEQTANWFIAISNQCFEVWLYYHKNDKKIIPNDAAHMKQILSQQINGGYKLEVYAPEIKTAIINSAKLDEHKDVYFPDVGITKLYHLGNQIVSLLSYEDGIIKLS